MCGTCGCGDDNSIHITIPGQNHTHHHPHSHAGHEHNHEHSHEHSHDHDHEHSHDHSHSHGNSHLHVQEINLQQNILSKNNLLAERNRGFFQAKGILALNLVSSPGSGKTSVLEKTILDIGKQKEISVVEGDQQTLHDAERIIKAGAKAIQINTGRGCHLDAYMVNDAINQLKPENNSLLFIENVGNLVCPSMFDLGENFRVVIISVTEGDDKPLKYPDMFATSTLCIINKIDLLPYVNFDVEKLKENAMRINHHLDFIELSASSGEGMQAWYNWLDTKLNNL